MNEGQQTFVVNLTTTLEANAKAGPRSEKPYAERASKSSRDRVDNTVNELIDVLTRDTVAHYISSRRQQSASFRHDVELVSVLSSVYSWSFLKCGAPFLAMSYIFFPSFTI